MRFKHHIDKARRPGRESLVFLLAFGMVGAPAFETASAAAIPERCAGYGELQSISLTDWEAGLGSWTVAKTAAVGTPDWEVTGGLPDGRADSAAFVPNLAFACGDSDESGVLRLTSPSIAIPGGAVIPRVSVKHWFELEPDTLGSFYDGGNLWVSVGAGPFKLVPAAAIEITSYQATLAPAFDEFGVEDNTNPLAGQQAFAGTYNDAPTGSWVESRINLFGIAQAGDTIRLRFDFGIDACGGAVGWYVDEVEFYYCPAELPPSNCGNGVINGTEQCDDGNNFIGDGCSNTCQVEPGWLCAAPTSPVPVPDFSFEAGTPNPFWTENSNAPRGTPICEVALCGTAGGTGPSHGDFWVYLGGLNAFDERSVSQSILIPSTVSKLTFHLEIPSCDSEDDYFEVLVDGNRELLVDGSSELCGVPGYSKQTVDISAYADNAFHEVEFHSLIVTENGGVSRFFIDVVELPGKPSICRREGTSLTLVKHVINDDGGEALMADWTLSASGPSSFGGAGPVVWGDAPFSAGTYNLSESGGPPGYFASAWDCVGGTQVDDDTVTVAPDEAVTCTITNDDRAPTLTVVNTIVNDNFGAATDPDAFGLSIDGLPTQHEVPQIVGVGDHTVSALGLPGYTAGPWGGDCSPDGVITLSLGEDATCTITHDDIAYPPSLTVVKKVINDNEGAATIADFGVSSSGGTLLFDDGIEVGNTTTYTAAPLTNLMAGVPYSLSENNVAGYNEGSWTCLPNAGGGTYNSGSVTLQLGESATCAITNNDQGPSLTVIKRVINDNGGTAAVAAFQVSSNAGPLLFDAGSTVGSTTTYTAAPLTNLTAGVPYSLSEANVAGYAEGNWTCSPNAGGGPFNSGLVTLGQGEAVTCSITNNDQAPSLTVVKKVVNDNGGAASVAAFNVSSSAGPLVFDAGSKVGTTTTYTAATLPNLMAGVPYSLSEANVAGYTEGSWTCSGNGGGAFNSGSVILGLNEAATCTITNDDSASRLVLAKNVINDSGGLAEASSWTLTASGPSTFSGTGPFVASGEGFLPGIYDLSESGPSNYTASDWECGDGSAQLDANTVEVGLGSSILCIVTNNDTEPKLTLVNAVTNDSGGSASPNSFGLKINGSPVLNNSAVSLFAGSHQVSADGLAGYQATAWGGDCNPDGTITLSLAEEAVCTIGHDDITPTLTVVKQVNNQYGGTAVPADFTMQVIATDPSQSSFPGTGLPGTTITLDAGAYSVSESGLPSGYQLQSASADCSGSIALAENRTCTIVNGDTDGSTRLILNKVVINDDGGTAAESNWYLLADGPTPIEGPGGPGSVDVQSGTGFSAGTYALSESAGPAGYAAGSWHCVGGLFDAKTSELTLDFGDAANCTVINNDIAPRLTVIKHVLNDNGGTATVAAFNVSSSAGPLAFGAGSTVGNTTTYTAEPLTNLLAGVPYSLSEANVAGYAEGNWSCTPNTGGGAYNSGSVILDLNEAATCTITNDDQPPGLTIVKRVVNDNGGTATVAAFNLSSSAGPLVFGTGSTVGNITTYTAAPLTNLTAGVPYSLSEANVAGYSEGNWSCVPNVGSGPYNNGTVTLAPGQAATCTIANNDQAPGLTIVKKVVNDNGGTATVVDFNLSSSAGPLVFDAGSTIGNTTTYTAVPLTNLAAGVPYSLSEADVAGYTEGNWTCTPNAGGGAHDSGSVILGLNEAVTCTITNNDQPPRLTVIKKVVNDNGGTATVVDFNVSSSAGPLVFGAGSTVGNTTTYTAAPLTNLTAGVPYTLTEVNLTGYSEGSWSCAPNVGSGAYNNGSVTLGPGEAATCTITNNDQAPRLTVVKKVVNDNGGTATVAAFNVSSSAGSLVFGAGSTVGNTTTYTAAPLTNLVAGVPYSLSESNVAGYAEGSWSCTPNAGGGAFNSGSVTLTTGEAATCTITNNDQAPGLTVVKKVINDNGGSATVATFNVSSSAGPLVFDAGSTVDNTTTYTAAPLTDLTAGVPYSLSEANVAGYAEGTWVCTSAGGGAYNSGSVTLELNNPVTCSITNNDIAPSLTLVKQVTNDDGGTAVAADWTLTASGPSALSGPGPSVSSGGSFKAGTYDLAESGGPAGYVPSSWDCSGDSQIDADTVTLALGETATCTITNDDAGPGLTLVKQVQNDNGGTALPSAWMLTASGPTGFTGPGPIVPNDEVFMAGTYTLSESTGPDGYMASDWVCSGGVQQGANTVIVAPGEAVTCTITNDDDAPSLTLVKKVINDNGGTATPSAWTLTASGPSLLNGTGPNVFSGPGFKAGTYNLSESAGPQGYTASAWVCSGVSQDDADTVTLGLGESATCTITNNDVDQGEVIFGDGFELE